MVNLVAVTTIALALLILSGFLLLHHNLQQVVVSSAPGLSVSAYLADDLSPEALKKTRAAVEKMPGVAAAEYVDKKMAMADLKKRLGDQADVLDGLEENPLPASLELELEPGMRESGRTEALIAALRNTPGIEDVDYAWAWADKLQVFIRFVRLSGIVLGGLLFLAVVFIVANTIRLTVLSRADEMYLLRLMGATEGFVRAPFYLEGFLQGLCGGLLALAALFVLYLLLASQVRLPLGLSMIRFSFLPAGLLWLAPASGGVLGLLGSMLSLSRFMRT